MPARPHRTSPTPVSTQVDRYLLVCLYLMLITGFGTVAATGQLDGISVVAVTAALIWRGYLLLTHSTLTLHEKWTTRLAIGFGLFYLADVFLISRSFLTATVHLVLLGLVVKIFSPLRDRDYVLLALLSFAMVLAASVLTVDSAFFITFSLFLLMAVGTFVLLQMRRAAASAGNLAPVPNPVSAQHGLSRSLALATPAILLMILCGAAGIFFVLPRVAAGYAGGYTSGNDLSTGFSDEVRLGRIGEIQQSDAVVMHVQFEGNASPPWREIKWRGVALSSFNGTSWSIKKGQFLAPKLPDGRFLVALLPLSRANLLRYQVSTEPLNSNVFFLAEQPVTLAGAYGLVSLDAGGAVYDLDRERPVSEYKGESSALQFREPAPGEESNYPPEILNTYLQLPDLDPRIVGLAREITSGLSTEHDRAVALENHLRTHYGYTLKLPATAPRDPLANFLFERKQGHCEYFASAMAVMLRSVGIPSRVVNGFRGGEFNDVSGKYLIRARDAHSWVEAYFPGQGWISFDPTPASLGESEGKWNRLALYLDAMTSFWREWIVNYDFSHQKSLGEDGIRKTRTWIAQLRQRIARPYASLLHGARAAGNMATGATMSWTRAAAGFVGLVLLLDNANRMRRWSRQIFWKRTAAKAPQQAASLWYERMTKAVGQRGWRKAPGQTPVEFVEEISDAGVKQSVGRFTRHYERARFAGSTEDAQRLPELYEEITTHSR